MQVFDYANALNDGDFNGIWKGRYLARYSQQLGLTTLLRGFFLIFGRGNYLSFQYFNACMLPVIIQHLPLKSPQQPDQNHNPEGNQHNQCILAQLYCIRLYSALAAGTLER